MSLTSPGPHHVMPPPGPVNATHRPLLRRWLGGGAILIALLLGGLVLAASFDAALGVQVALVAAAVALLPLAIVLPAFLWLDRQEAEPVSSLLLAFAWGALVSTAVSLVINSIAGAVIDGLGFDASLLGAVVVAPVVEECAKGAGVLVVWLVRRREFDGVVDGVVYAGVVAAGFAFGENVLYLGQALLEGGTMALATTFVLRGLVSPFAHPLFTMWTGAGIGLLAVGRSPARLLAPVGGLLAAIGLHSLWNGGSFLGLEGWLGSYLLVQVPVFVAAVCFVMALRRRERIQMRAHLDHYVRLGVFAPTDVVMLTEPALRRRARAAASGVGGRPARAAMRDLQDDAVELAFLRGRMLRGRAAPDAIAEERQLVESVVRARALFTVR